MGEASSTIGAGGLNAHIQRRNQTRLLSKNKNLLQENNEMLQDISAGKFLYDVKGQKMTNGISSNSLISAERRTWAADKNIANSH